MPDAKLVPSLPLSQQSSPPHILLMCPSPSPSVVQPLVQMGALAQEGSAQSASPEHPWSQLSSIPLLQISVAPGCTAALLSLQSPTHAGVVSPAWHPAAGTKQPQSL
jgi:hypothetical protein